MSDRACLYETAVVQAAQTGEWEDGLRLHVRRCIACAESVRLTEWFRNVAAYLGRDDSAPDPTYLWLRAQIERRERLENAISRLRLSMLASLGLVVGLVCAASILVFLELFSSITMVASGWLSTVIGETAAVDGTLMGTVGLGLPLILAAAYLLVFRPVR